MYSLEDLQSSSGVALYNYAKNLIPGGTQLFSKRPELYAPDVWPSYYSKAKGYKVWDLDGREFIDMSIMGVGACILGYADDEVDEAVIGAIKSGVASSLNCPEEVQLAEKLIELHPWFGMVRYARGGGEAIAIAVRIARAHTNREKILFSGYHGWNDWYLAANLNDKNNLDGHLMPGLEPKGVPRCLIGSAIPFTVNSIESIREKIKNSENQIAAIVIEPARGEDAPLGYLRELRALATEIGAVLIFDEITSGFRMCAGGIHRVYDVHPDIAVFAKSIANGYAMSVVLGTEKVMQSAQKTFISSTNWTERIGPSAALATLKKYQREKVEKKLISVGNQVKSIWNVAATANGINIKVSGLPTLASFSIISDKASELNTIFTLEMLKSGILGFRQFKAAFVHDDSALKKYKSVVDQTFSMIKSGVEFNSNNIKLQENTFKKLTRD